jgi:hypothetical protein
MLPSVYGMHCPTQNTIINTSAVFLFLPFEATTLFDYRLMCYNVGAMSIHDYILTFQTDTPILSFTQLPSMLGTSVSRRLWIKTMATRRI